jgi:hypothetical protein
MQQSSSLTNIQLSLNRLDGVLEDDAFQRMPPDATLELFANRISGDLPSYLYDTDNKGINPFNQTNILNGNLFTCSKPPDVDEKSGSYSCGSSSIDAYKWVYLVVAVMMVVVSIFVFLNKESMSRYKFRQYFRSIPFPSSFFSSGKQLVDRSRRHSGIFGASLHCEGFTASGLSISQDGCIITLKASED